MASLNSHANFLYRFNLAQGPCVNPIYEKESWCVCECVWVWVSGVSTGGCKCRAPRNSGSARPERLRERPERDSAAPPVLPRRCCASPQSDLLSASVTVDVFCLCLCLLLPIPIWLERPFFLICVSVSPAIYGVCSSEVFLLIIVHPQLICSSEEQNLGRWLATGRLTFSFIKWSVCEFDHSLLTQGGI